MGASATGSSGPPCHPEEPPLKLQRQHGEEFICPMLKEKNQVLLWISVYIALLWIRNKEKNQVLLWISWNIQHMWIADTLRANVYESSCGWKDTNCLLEFYYSVGQLRSVEEQGQNVVLFDADRTFHAIKALK